MGLDNLKVKIPYFLYELQGELWIAQTQVWWSNLLLLTYHWNVAKQGIFAAFHSNCMQESDLGLSSK